MKKIGVIGLGNPLRCDDGIGIVLLELVRKNRKDFSKRIEFVDGGTGGMNLLHFLAQYGTALIIDAVLFDGRPGEIRFFDKKEILRKSLQVKLSTHEADFFQILRLSKELKELPSQLFFFGIQPKNISHGTKLSPELTYALPRIYEELVMKIKALT